MTKQFKYPCAVGLEGLTQEDGIRLEEAFAKLGVELYDQFSNGDRTVAHWLYYGVAYSNETQVYDSVGCFDSDDDADNVTVYTYDEIMSFVEELEKPEQTNSDGWIENTGEEPEYLLDGGSIDVMFNDGEMIKGVTDDCRRGVGNGNVPSAAYNFSKGDLNWQIKSWKPSITSSVSSGLSLEEKEYLEWGNWEEGDKIVFCGFSDKNQDHWEYEVGKTYTVKRRGGYSTGNLAPESGNGDIPSLNWGFNFKKLNSPATSPDVEAGASVNIEVTINLGELSIKTARDNAFKVYRDLKVIFEEKIV